MSFSSSKFLGSRSILIRQIAFDYLFYLLVLAVVLNAEWIITVFKNEFLLVESQLLAAASAFMVDSEGSFPDGS